jgi:hypothetical protein
MSGYQISNNVPTYFIPNAQQELGQSQINFLMDRMNKPTETSILANTTRTLTCDEVLNGFVTLSPNGGPLTVQFPVGSELFDCIQEKVYGQQGILVNEGPFRASGSILGNPNISIARQAYFQLTDGFSVRFAIYNRTGNTVTFNEFPADATLIPNNNGANNTMPTNKVNNMVFTVLDAATKTMAVNFEGANNFN